MNKFLLSGICLIGYGFDFGSLLAKQEPIMLEAWDPMGTLTD